jgi:hypothetical protein
LNEAFYKKVPPEDQKRERGDFERFRPVIHIEHRAEIKACHRAHVQNAATAALHHRWQENISSDVPKALRHEHERMSVPRELTSEMKSDSGAQAVRAAQVCCRASGTLRIVHYPREKIMATTTVVSATRIPDSPIHSVAPAP